MYLGIDFGKKRIGLALGVLMPHVAGVIDGELSSEIILGKILKICQENEVEKIIIGLPIRSQGEEGTLAGTIREFAADVAEFCQLPVYFEPEQYTSSEAERILVETDNRGDKSRIDEMAAVLLLEQFISRLESEGANSVRPDFEVRDTKL
ncbi:MAG: Holliday junction resolvase RuvX [bacterium]